MAVQNHISLETLSNSPFDAILDLRFCEILWPQNLLEPYEIAIDDVVEECATLGLWLDLKFFAAREWLSPEDSTSVGIPFFLYHPKLLELEKSMGSDAEGSTIDSFKKLLRHEIAHCFDHAYKISSQSEFRKWFGNPKTPYRPESYSFNPQSKTHVVHLPDGYSQAHPLEDFAETFAVWVASPSQAQKQYSKHPMILNKFKFMDTQIKNHSLQMPFKNAPIFGRARDSVITLRQHYKTRLKALSKPTAHVNIKM